MARLPEVGGDQDSWGDVLNDYLSVAHNSDGSLQPIDQSKVTGLQADLSNKYPKTGGVVSGAVVVNAVDGPTSLPLGRSQSLSTGINISSSFGGEDDGTGTDTTGRLNLYSYQRAQTGSFGETVRHFLMRSDSKAMNAWYMPKAGYNSDETPNESEGWSPIWWIGAHWKANDQQSVHGHGSIEIPDTTGALQTRFEVPFIDQDNPPAPGDPIGIDITNIRTNLADLSVRASSGVFRVGGPNQYNKDILLSTHSGRSSAYERWKIRANSTTEAAGNEGTDFELRRHDNNGGYAGTAMFVKRSNGNVTFGASSSLSARVSVVWSANGSHGFYAKPGVDVGNGAAFAGSLFNATARAFDMRVDNDANARVVIYADGKHEFGDGTAARDTNLYRSAADVLRTDDTFHVGVNLRVNTTSVGAGAGVVAIANAATVPTANPTAGGILYVEAGALKFRGSSGTITTVANA